MPYLIKNNIFTLNMLAQSVGTNTSNCSSLSNNYKKGQMTVAKFRSRNESFLRNFVRKKLVVEFADLYDVGIHDTTKTTCTSCFANPSPIAQVGAVFRNPSPLLTHYREP
jgi:hypothetical protein